MTLVRYVPLLKLGAERVEASHCERPDVDTADNAAVFVPDWT